ncbi:phosphocholine cytidylyltransferase/choline kinase family protein [Cytobacillus gottheilii]|uniref:phosphocholine cytidylyltransferase/choline kinase family protein n=1 Tax=Cytobacillus gottheilii TaxID=859144 RepID=UPI0009BAC1F2|nr:phosphocholine cytidylyltransferase/choline kinase family protein [Cytobacillus gottheilii]
MVDNFKIMDIISNNPDLSQREIAEKCHVSVGKINYMISNLLSNGLLEVEKSHKKHRYSLTKAGKRVMKIELEQLQETKVRMHHEEKRVNCAVILAAGKKRELDMSAGLISIGEDETLIKRTLNILKNNGINKVIIVTGFKSWSLEAQPFLINNPDIHLVHNSNYEWTGSMASLAIAKEFVDDDFILIEDDILIEEQAITKLIESKERDCILITKESGSGDEAYIEIKNNYLYKISKDIHQLNRIDGEMIGVTKISYDVYNEMLENFKSNKNPFMNYEYMLLDVSRKLNIGYLKISDLFWAEVDNLSQLDTLVDKVYPMLLRKEAQIKEQELKEAIGKAINIDIEAITHIEPFGGMTNKNYKMIINDEDWVVRVAGLGTGRLINRREEKINSNIAVDMGVYPEILYFDEHGGLKISKMIPNAETLNVKTAKRMDMMQLIKDLLRKVHDSDKIIPNDFDFFDKLCQYEQLTIQVNGVFYEGYEAVREKVMQIKEDYELFPVNKVPCHNDTIPENFVRSGDEKLYLIDWEYGGMNDPLWDIATLTLEGFSPEEERRFLTLYLEGELTEELDQRMLINKIFADFLWTVWTIYKEACGENYGTYGQDRFQRVKKNINEYNLLYKGIRKI